jgi:hypothetical protein
VDPDLGFPLSLSVTLILLALVVTTGVRGLVALHIPLVALAVSSLGITIYFAERLGQHYDLASAGMITPIHLSLAKVATVAYLLPLSTGIATLRNRRWRPVHFWCAMVVLVLTVITAVTGSIMIAMSERIVP